MPTGFQEIISFPLPLNKMHKEQNKPFIFFNGGFPEEIVHNEKKDRKKKENPLQLINLEGCRIKYRVSQAFLFI